MELTLENIRKQYDGKLAVNDLSLHVPSGVIYGIIGPNGAGKTTTIRMIMDIIRPDAGRVLFGGQPSGDAFKNRVGYLPEERGLYKKVTVLDIMLYLASLKGKTRADVEDRIDLWLERMQLQDYKDRKVEELSKGMAQKLQFITTILHDPEIVILDELFSGLDPINIELIKTIILELKRAGKTILFSTHVMEQAEKLCDHLCMISAGNKVLDGKLVDVKAQFGKNTVQVDIDGDGSFAQDLDGVIKVTEFNNYLELRLDEGADTQALLKAISDRVTVRRFEVMEPSLYDIFIDMAKVDPEAAESEQEASHV